MAYDQNQMNNSVFDDLKEKFSQLDQRQQIGVVLGVGLVSLILLSRLFGGSSEPVPEPIQQQTGEVRKVQLNSESVRDKEEDLFSAEGADESVLRRNFVTKTLGEFETLKEELQEKEATRIKESQVQKERLKGLELQLEQSIRALNEDRRSFQQTIARQQEENARLIEDLKQQRIKEKETAGSVQQQQDFLSQKPIRERRQGISQTPLSLVTAAGTSGTPLVQGLTGGIVGGEQGVERNGVDAVIEEDERKPFIPPLGFIKGTMLNGVDALTGGAPTPSLVRLEGSYKTAMNSTVILNGCFMLVEFQGDISTERAKGKPARMTCVYPDQGAVTYSVSGYVVDSEDGVEGVPGLFFEGHAGRIALSIAAEFAAGIGDIIESNQSTSIVSSDGTTQTVITGSEAKASMYGSASDSLNSLKDYLADRASRVVPFIRIDALREVHIVLLSGTELRNEGDAWSQLFNAE